MIGRLLLAGGVVMIAFAAVWMWERRGGLVRSGLPSGLTIATSDACTICDAALGAIVSAGPDLPVRVVDASELAHLKIRSVPTVLVADGRGEVVLRRSGRAAVTDAEAIVRAARAVA